MEAYTFVYRHFYSLNSPFCLTAGPNDHTIAQIKDAVRDGLRSVKNTIEDEAVVLVRFWSPSIFLSSYLCLLIFLELLVISLNLMSYAVGFHCNDSLICYLPKLACARVICCDVMKSILVYHLYLIRQTSAFVSPHTIITTITFFKVC